MDIATATFDELKQARDQINARLLEMERTAIEELEERAKLFGFQLTKNGHDRSLKPTLPKYGDGHGNYWSGKGRKPHWLNEALSAGASLEDFRL
jgi:DNA-binding protein H-NS